MEKQLKRSEVPEALKWDLTLLYESDEAMEQALAKTQQKASELAKTAGHFASDGQTFLRNLNENKAIDEELEREFVYGMLRRDSDTTDSTAVTLYGQVVNAATTIEAELAFIQPELTAIDDADFAKLMQSEPGLAEYQYEMTKLRRQKKHVLSKAEETLLGHLNKSLDSAEEIYNTLNDADLKFGKVHDEKGQLVELTHGNRSQFNESQNRSVRKEAVLAYEKPYHELRNTFAQTLNSFIGTENALARIRHYPSARAAALGANNIPESVYDTLVATVNQYLDLVYRWYELKKRVLGLDKMYKYDVNVPLAGEDMLKTTFEQGKQLTWDALQVMGPEYLKGLKSEFEHRWIDARLKISVNALVAIK
ncbi:M3 family oligoendopeptidase [Limosilactobacillus mucosae]|uniref:M3 family oligoendopeptidase n=1 Tax=Limosilactobacillus mucosae TaxID=97478 RepID=UPI0022E50FAD|nr:M3 family metallopeptidase [Limosilactobacillus mucosae]